MRKLPRLTLRANVHGVDRVEVFLGDRLRGRPVPADLYRLVELQLEGVLDGDDGPRGWEVRLLSPGELHALQEPPVSRPWAPLSDAVSASVRATNEVLSHVAVIADGFDGHLYGYWLHPDEPPEPNPPIVMLDSEGQFGLLDGTTLVEALGLDPEFCDAHAIPITERSQAQLRRANAAVDPAVLHDALYAREKTAMTQHGFPQDQKPHIEAADLGSSEET